MANVLMLANRFPTDKEPYRCLFLKELEEQLVKYVSNHYVLSLHDYNLLKRLKRLKEISDFIKTNKIDIIHAQFGFPAGFYGALIKKKKIFIVTVHRFELFEKKIRPLVRYGLKKADLIIAVSNYIHREIINLDPKLEKKTVVLLNGVNTEKFAKEEIKFVKKGEVIKIGTLAHHSKRKGIDKLVKAFKYLEEKEKNVELHIAGKGPETENLIQLTKDLKIKNIHFHGNISEKEKVEFYRMLDIFVLSSDNEGHPVALLESMCSGACPVVSNIPSIEDTVFDKKNGRIFDLNNVNELAEILNELTDDIEALNKYKKEARRKVVEDFNLNKRAEKLSEIYKKLIEKNKQ